MDSLLSYNLTIQLAALIWLYIQLAIMLSLQSTSYQL